MNFQISREAQDEYAVMSYKRSQESAANGVFDKEITPVGVPQRKGPEIQVTADEEYRKVNFDKFKMLRPAFQKEGGKLC
jgi:acetyl-CoA C-acetyltransferase